MSIQNLDTRLAGITNYKKAGQNLKYFKDNGKPVLFHLERDQDNPYDPNAVKVLDKFSNLYGYIQAADAPIVARCMDSGGTATIIRYNITGGYADGINCGLQLRIRLYCKKKL